MIGAAVMAVAFFGVSTGVGIGGALPGSNWPGIVAVVFIWLYFTAFSGGCVQQPDFRWNPANCPIDGSRFHGSMRQR